MTHAEAIFHQIVDTIPDTLCVILPATVSIAEPTTLGLQLVKALSLQLDGTLEFTIGKGTLARLRFPLEGPA